METGTGAGPASQLHCPRHKHPGRSWCSTPGSAACDWRSRDSLHPVEKSRTRLQGQHREMRQNSKHCNPAQQILYLTLVRGRLVWDPCWGTYLATPPGTAVSRHNSQQDTQLETTSSDKATEATAAPWSCRARTLPASRGTSETKGSCAVCGSN